MEDALADELRELREENGGREGWIRFGADTEISTCCPCCRDEQILSECEMKREGNDTVYWCRNGCQVVVVSPLKEPLMEEGETPWGEHIVRNVAEVRVPLR